MKNFLNKTASLLKLSRGERVGMLFLLAAIIGGLYVKTTLDFSSEISHFDACSAQIISKQQFIDSLRLIEIERRKPKVYPFNPNFLTDYKAYVLGITPLEHDRLKEYRSKGKWIRSASHFQQITDVSDSLLLAITPLFKFPKWTQTPKYQYSKYKSASKALTYEEKIDLNTASAVQLKKVSGVGEVLSQRIVQYREKLGGFSSIVQLQQVWGLKPGVVEKVKQQFALKTPKEIRKFDLNKASASDLATIPGISFELAKDIWEFVRVRDGVKSVSEIGKIEKLSAYKLQLIELYLFVE